MLAECSLGPGRARSARSGRVPVWMVLGLFVSCTLWLVSAVAHEVEAAGFAVVDPRSSKLDVQTGFVDPRWNDWMAERLARLPRVSAFDAAGLQRIVDEIGRLPFVAQVGTPRVLWPDGLDLPLCLRRPVACILQGGEYTPVAEDGTLLPGRWPTPPWIQIGPGHARPVGSEGSAGHLGFLPVIGPNDGALETAAPGDRLVELRHRDALAVAIEMQAAFGREEFELFGPPLIDASRARQASLEVPGVVIFGEGRRVVWFGRPPGADAPGERPSEAKWAALKKALLHLRGANDVAPPPGARDWSFLDVRFENGDIHWRDAKSPPSGDSSAQNPAKK
jgi:hypothetical protein